MYTYNELRRDVCALCRQGAECGSIGRSVAGQHIVYVRLGPKDGGQIIVQGGIHAREWVTSVLVMRQIRFLMRERLPLGVYFLPMTNPDGCTLAQSGTGAFPDYAASVGALAGAVRLWKANLRGVDLNCNFDARWGRGAGNVREPAPSSFVGYGPESEPETRALAAFTRRVRPVLTVSYHALGREVYYEFGQTGERLKRDRAIAAAAADWLRYRLVHGDLGSAGGYKDWCVSALGIPALTIETVSEKHSHPLDESDLIGEERNLWLPLVLAKLMKKNSCAPL